MMDLYSYRNWLLSQIVQAKFFPSQDLHGGTNMHGHSRQLDTN